MALLSLIGPATKLIGKYVEHKGKKAELASKLATLAEDHAQELAKGQIDINKEQAKHPSIFVSGARPAIMWVCCLGLLWQFFIQPIVTYVAVLYDPEFVMSLLGLGAMRSFEKSRGIARENMKK